MKHWTAAEREGVKAQYGPAWVTLRRKAKYERLIGHEKDAEKTERMARHVHAEMSEPV